MNIAHAVSHGARPHCVPALLQPPMEARFHLSDGTTTLSEVLKQASESGLVLFPQGNLMSTIKMVALKLRPKSDLGEIDRAYLIQESDEDDYCAVYVFTKDDTPCVPEKWPLTGILPSDSFSLIYLMNTR